MKYQTPIEALTTAIELWQYIADNNLYHKQDAYEELWPNEPGDLSYCPLCQYCKDSLVMENSVEPNYGKYFCSECPAKAEFIDDTNDGSHYDDVPCLNSAAYIGWYRNPTEGALRMVNLLEKALARHKSQQETTDGT